MPLFTVSDTVRNRAFTARCCWCSSIRGMLIIERICDQTVMTHPKLQCNAAHP